MKNFKQISSGLDMLAIRVWLLENPHIWNRDTFRQDHPLSPHKQTQFIILHGPKEMTAQALIQDLDSEDKLILEEPDFYNLISWGGHIIEKLCVRAMLVRMEPHSKITPHIDQGPFAEATERYHMGISCPAGSILYAEDEFVHIREGEVWRFNKHVLHWAENNSDYYRIHLIVDVMK